MSAYLLGNIIFAVVWAILFIVFSRERKLQITGSLLLLPFAVLDIWFRPDYWRPPLLIHAIEPFSIETAIYCFAAGGIAATIGHIFLPNKIRKINWINIFYFIIFSFGLFAIFELTRLSNAMNNLNFVFLIIFAVFFVRRIKESYKAIFLAVIFPNYFKE